MSRVEENNKIVQKCKKSHEELQEKQSILDLAGWHLGLIELFLIDISKSLAVIADAGVKTNDKRRSEKNS